MEAEQYLDGWKAIADAAALSVAQVKRLAAPTVSDPLPVYVRGARSIVAKTSEVAAWLERRRALRPRTPEAA